MLKSAIVIGATGLTGSIVLEKLLADSAYSKIKLFSRKSCGVNNPKLEEHLMDLFQLESAKSDFTADELYCCIGTTKKKTPDEEMYRAIDFGIPATAAKLAQQNGITSMAVVSAIGADTKSNFFYNRTKGEMEQAVLNAGIERTFILRPSIIAGDRIEKRAGEKFSIGLFKLLKPLFFGKLKKYRAVEAEAIADKMIQLINSNSGSRIVESNEI